MRYLITIHRILGTVLSILFLMWFATGLVMIYHHYPSVSDTDRLAHTACLDSTTLPVDSLLQAVKTIDHDSIVEMEMTREGSSTMLIVKGDNAEECIDASTACPLPRFTRQQLDPIASTWSVGRIESVNSMSEIDIWLVGAYPVKEYPVYKYSFTDDDATELYLSSRTGRAVQCTTDSTRLWAWLGPIPHWLYIKQLRANGRQPWSDVVLWVSGIGTLMTLAGIIIGIRSMLISRRQRHALSPYKKPMFKWHHITGLIFGHFVFTFVFSGYMSLQKVPQWMIPVNDSITADGVTRGRQYLDLTAFKYDYRALLAKGGVRRITWTARAGKPVLIAADADTCHLYDASADSVSTISVNEAFCTLMAHTGLPTTMRYNIRKVTSFEDGYSSVRGSRMRSLPVYCISTDDEYGTRFYVSPKDGKAILSDTNTRVRGLLYGGLHSLNFAFFDRHQWLRETILWILMLGGCVVSFTGVVLGWRYIRRKIRRH